jgi:hypothetical protein
LNEGPREERERPAVRGISLGVLAALVLLVIAIGISIATHDEETTTTIVRPTPNVIVAVRDLARLETSEYHVERVIDLRDRQERVFGLVEAEDAILLVAVGKVQAGVDLSQLEPEDVVVDEEAGTVEITLPEPEVFDTFLDNEKTFVHSRETDVLARRAIDLETRARQEAERTITNAALEGGILDRARENAERTVRSVVSGLGYREVTIRFGERAPSTGSVIGPAAPGSSAPPDRAREE